MRKKKSLDFPITDVLKKAQKWVDKGATVHQKWTCAHCGARQTMEKANAFFTEGRCEECEKVTNIESRGCNFMMIFISGAKP